MAKLKVHLIVIDGQNDFCDIPEAECPTIGGVKIKPALPVAGANADMGRIARLIRRVGPRLADIHCTMDSHRKFDIAHPMPWMDQNQQRPGPFTLISDKDVEAGIWGPRNPRFHKRFLDYVKALQAGGKFTLCIWPEHCLIGTWGHNIHAELNAALQEWSDKEVATVDYVTKGSNVWTEHYGALMAEVPDPSDPGTALNTDFLTILSEADVIGVTGEASSHCVRHTVDQILQNIGDAHVRKFHLITDCMSSVGAIPNVVDFPKLTQAWFQDTRSKYGVTLTEADAFMA